MFKYHILIWWKINTFLKITLQTYGFYFYIYRVSYVVFWTKDKERVVIGPSQSEKFRKISFYFICFELEEQKIQISEVLVA